MSFQNRASLSGVNRHISVKPTSMSERPILASSSLATMTPRTRASTTPG
jgi:hypothetical protein